MFYRSQKQRALKNSFLILLGFLFTSCAARQDHQKQTAVINIQLVDRSGVSETISDPDRIRMLERVDILKSQPYQRVSKVYARNEEGMVPGELIVYHSNGQPWQYLQTKNGRAFGLYKEWFQNGVLRMKANIVEGLGDLTSEAHLTWVFDGKSQVWDEKGNLVAEIYYDKGVLSGQSTYYHENGEVSKTVPFVSGKIHGDLKLFSKKGAFIGKTFYEMGEKDQESFFNGDHTKPKRIETYHKGLLFSGKYWSFDDRLTFEVEDGNGICPVYKNGKLRATHEYQNGKMEGEVRVYRENEELESVYHIKEGVKHGEEWCYFEGKDRKPMLYITWREDEIHGVVRTWYPSGVLESEKEMMHNKKDGPLLAWYDDGSLMMVEKYENDFLVSGKYLKKGEETPSSRVIDGDGVATIFDEKGLLVRKINYQRGQPVDSK